MLEERNIHAPNCTYSIQTDRGEITGVITDPLPYYKGFVNKDPGQTAILVVTPDHIRGRFMVKGKRYYIEPVSNYDKACCDKGLFILHEGTDVPEKSIDIPNLDCPLELFYNVDRDLKGLLTADTATAAALENYHLDITFNLNELSRIDSSLAFAANPGDSLDFLAERASVLADLQAIAGRADSLDQAFMDQIASGLPAVKSYNLNITATEIYEENEQEVNDLFMRTLALGDALFDSLNQARLFAIADQCPLEGGDGVYRARSLYALIDPGAAYDDEQLCRSAERPVASANEPGIIEPPFNLFPNPARDYILIELVFDIENAAAGFSVYNSYGYEVRRIQIPAGGRKFFLDTSGLPSGVYTCRLKVNKAFAGAKKFIIIK
jgi:hypothetical protein